MTTNAKIEISVGPITFSGEGTQEWLEKQLDKLLASAPTLATIHPGTHSGNQQTSSGHTDGDPGTLPGFLQKKNGTKNQVRRFLATAEWLHLKGSKRLQTADVTKALSDANQARLSNPANCLNQNVTKGHCQKEGKMFFVTPEGKTHLG